MELREPDPWFISTVSRYHLLNDDDRNWRWGFGKGVVGLRAAHEAFRALVNSEDPLLSCRVVWDGEEILALLAFRFLPEERRSICFMPYVFDHQNGSEIIEEGTAMLFSLSRQSVHRIETELLTRAKPEQMMFKTVGYRQEGKKREALWMGTHALDTRIMAITRPEFMRRKAAA